MKHGNRFINLIDKSFTRLTVIKEAGRDKRGNVTWLCICDCETVVIINGNHLRSGHTQSCGCLRNELASERNKERIGNKHPMYGKKRIEHSKKMRGKKHWNWQGGISPENHILRVSLKSKQWRLGIFERDNYTCQICKDNKGGNLNAHHILRWSKFKSLRYTLANGITLCKDCHRFIHSKKYNDQSAIHKFLISKIKENNKCHYQF